MVALSGRPVLGSAFRSLASIGAAMGIAVAAFGIGAAVEAPPTLMSREDYRDELRLIEAQWRRALAGCRALERHARNVCRAEVRADDRVRRAELEARYEGTVQAARAASQVRARARFDVARARCLAGEASLRLPCLREARGEGRRSLAGAKLPAT